MPPTYVEYKADVSSPGPVNCEDAALYMFVVAGQYERLEQLCKRMFSAPSGGKVAYAPLSRLLIMTIGHIPRITSGSLDLGTLAESQMTVWVPVAAVHQRGGRRFVERIGVFPALMVVDNVYSLASGRESYGIFKCSGWIETPTAPQPTPPEQLGVDVYGMGQFGGQNAPRRWHLLGLRRDPAGSGATGQPLEGHSAFVGQLRALLRAQLGGSPLLPGLELPVALIEDLARSSLPLVTLKQIRAAGGLGADHQAILETPVSLRRLRAVQLLDAYDLTVTPHLAGFPLGQDLGLASQRALLSFKVELDFTIGSGRTIWRAEEPAPPGCLGRLLGLASRR